MINTESVLQIKSDEVPKYVDPLELSEKLSIELFRSPFKSKIKIITISVCFGPTGINAENKFSIKIDGRIESDDMENIKLLKENFISITNKLVQNRKIAEEMIQFFWEVKVAQKFEIGAKFPGLEGCFNQYGNKNKIEHDEGRVMLLDIWATWCGYCVKPMDENIKISRELKKDEIENVDIIAISADTDKQHKEWVDFIKTKKWMEIDHYRNKSIMETLELSGIPHIFIVDKKGFIFYSGHPSKIDLKETLKKLSKGELANTDEKLTIEKQLTTKEDPNPQWDKNKKEEREEMVSMVNDMIMNKGIDTVKFVVSTKLLFSDGKRLSYSQPIFSGYVLPNQFEMIQEVGIIVSEDFGLKDVQYNLKMLN